MTTRKQIEANQSNAKKSTGPKTEAGKRRSRRNARKHGLTAEVLVTRDEDGDKFSELREALMEEHDPQTTMECDLVERIASIVWRLRRVPTFEAGVIDFRLEQAMEDERRRQEDRGERNHLMAMVRGKEREEDDTKPKQREEPDLLGLSITLGDALTTDFAYTNSLQKLDRHETSLVNMLKKTCEMLREAQANRKQNPEDEMEEETPRLH